MLLSVVRNLLHGAQRRLDQLAPFPPPPAGASDLEREAHRLLTRYVDEAVGSAYVYVWNVRPSDHAAGRAILEAAPAIQVAVVIAAIDRVQWLALHLQRTRSAYNESASLKPLIGQLCRRRQPYAEANVVGLLTLLALAERERWLYAVPLVTILRRRRALDRRTRSAGRRPPGAGAAAAERRRCSLSDRGRPQGAPDHRSDARTGAARDSRDRPGRRLGPRRHPGADRVGGRRALNGG